MGIVARSWIATAATALLLVAAACDGDAVATATDATTDAAAPGTDVALPDDDVTAGGCGALSVGQGYVFDSLTIDHPTDPAIQQLLNDLWRQDIDNGRLVVLYHLETLDPAARTLTMSAGNGVLTDGVYDFSQPPQTIEASFDASDCAFASSAPSGIEMAPSTVNKPIPFVELTTSGRFVDDAERIIEARIDGALPQADMEGLTFDVPLLGPTELRPLFELAGVVPEIDTDGDGTPDAYRLGGTYTARRLLDTERP